MANKEKVVFCLGSDGSQQEGNDAEAARLAVAQNLNVKLLIDDNDVTIAGHPSQYLKGYDVSKTLELNPPALSETNNATTIGRRSSTSTFGGTLTTSESSTSPSLLCCSPACLAALCMS
ncbi:hypothetical protein P692DRAFT_20836651 [Suillus brevipes Sb2]|nr:hypothetical protein P692DRAFT_20836651 [Suillus brevipes Sb2]